MARKAKKIVESDSEEEMAPPEKESEGEDEDESMDEEDLDDELGLPKELMSSVSLKEKRELLRYKESHNELEWENEMMTRIEQLSKKKDLERLKQMTGAAGGADDSAVTAKKSKRKATRATPVAPVEPAKKYAKGRELKRRKDEEDDDDDDDELEDEEEFDDASENESEMDVDDDEEDESDDDLFGEDEIEEISKKTKALQKKKPASKKGKQLRSDKKPAPRKRSRLEDYDESSDEGEEDEDVKWGDARLEDEQDRRERQRSGKKKQVEIEDEDTSDFAKLEDILKIQSRRVLLEKWHAEPYFENVVTGSFVRLSVGNTPAGEAIYRMAEVLEVIPMKPYKLPDINAFTERGLRVAIGSKTLDAKMYKVSNSRITQREHDEFVGVLEKANEEHLRLRINGLERRRKKIREASQHTYTHEEVAAMIQKNSMQTTKHTANFTHAMHTMKKELERARSEGDFESMEKVQKEMDKLEREMDASRDSYARKFRANTNINKRNKDRNIQMDMEAGARKREMDMKKTKEEKRKDPFARRETRPTILWVTGTKKASGGDETPATLTQSQQVEEPVAIQATVEPEEEQLGDDESSLEEIGKRLAKKIGFNPHLAALVDKRTRYLEAECRLLPSIGTEERNEVRQGISLAQYLQRVSEQMVE